MSRESADDPDGDEANGDVEGVDALAVTSNYKVLGEFSSQGGAAVLGQNNAGTGTSVGVKGTVPNDASGYGLETPDDARIEGDIETTNPFEVFTDGDRNVRVNGENNSGEAGNVLLGHSSNQGFFATGAAIGGGGFDDGSTTEPNLAFGTFPTVGGGRNNRINTVSDNYGTIGGGRSNDIGPNGSDSFYATIGGGRLNTIEGNNSNVTIGGGRDNTATSGTLSSVIGGGENHDILGVQWATIAGGDANEISGDGDEGTIGGGFSNEVTGDAATVGGGDNNVAGGSTGGTGNNVHQTIGGGTGNDATAEAATIGGGEANKADGSFATVPGGQDNRAQADYAFAAGRRAKAQDPGSFVWADSEDADFTSDDPDEFAVRAADGARFNSTNGSGSTMFLRGYSGVQSTPRFPSEHVMHIRDSVPSNSSLLALASGDSGPTDADNFITFYTSGNTAVGAIEGSGGTDINLVSGSADYAEYMPRLDPDEGIEAGDVVGVVGDAVTRDTTGADQVQVVSDRAIVTGNSPGQDRADGEDHETVAFVGQVPVKVRGSVEGGDLLVPSGEDDGTAEAVDPAAWRPGDGPLVGRALESDDAEGVAEVTALVGLDDPTIVGDRLAHYRDRIAELEAADERKDELIAEQRERIETLETENERLRDRLAEFDERLTAVEPGPADSPAPADD